MYTEKIQMEALELLFFGTLPDPDVKITALVIDIKSPCGDIYRAVGLDLGFRFITGEYSGDHIIDRKAPYRMIEKIFVVTVDYQDASVDKTVSDLVLGKEYLLPRTQYLYVGITDICYAGNIGTGDLGKV